MRDVLNNYSLSEQIRIDQDAADQDIFNEAIGLIDKSFEAAKEIVSDTLKRGENLLKRGRNSAEDYMEDAIHEVRHNSLPAMTLVFAGGALTGGMLALLWKRTKRLQKSSDADESVQ
jgi:hypothetical protein